MKLYRASNRSLAGQFFSFSPDRQVAEAYRDYRGYGGEDLFRYDVQPKKVLDVYHPELGHRVPIERLTEVVGSFTSLGPVDLVYEALENGCTRQGKNVAQALADLGYDWIIYADDFPPMHPPAKTWMLLAPIEIRGVPIDVRGGVWRKLKRKLLR